MNLGIFGGIGNALGVSGDAPQKVIARLLPAGNDPFDPPTVPISTLPQVTIEMPNFAYPYSNIALSGDRGTGAIMAHIPDETSYGGNYRGIHAVDWQLYRTLASQVASGDFSVVSGGSENTASGNYSVVTGGKENISSGLFSTTRGGYINTSSGDYATINGGESNVASGYASTILSGRSNIASIDYASAVGYGALANHYGEFAQATGFFSVIGDAQRSNLTLRSTGSDLNLVTLTLDGNVAGGTSSSQIILAANTHYTFIAYITAKQVGGSAGTIGDAAWWIIRGAIKRDGSGTSIVGTNAVTTDSDPGAVNWTVNVIADAIYNSLTIAALGEANKDLYWAASIDLTKVMY